MTAHSYSNWTLADPIEDAPIQEIAECIKRNGYRRPHCFAILGTADSLIYNISGFLEKYRGAILSRELVKDELTNLPEHQEVIVSIVIKVLEELNLLGVAQEIQKNPLNLGSLYEGLKKHSKDGKIQIQIPKIDSQN